MNPQRKWLFTLNAKGVITKGKRISIVCKGRPQSRTSITGFALGLHILTCWLSFGQVGLSHFVITLWVTLTNFIYIYIESQGLGFTLAR